MSSVCSNSMHLVEIFVLKRSARQPNLPDTNLPRTSQRMSLSRPIAKISGEEKSLGPGSPFPKNPFVAIPVESKIFVRTPKADHIPAVFVDSGRFFGGLQPNKAPTKDQSLRDPGHRLQTCSQSNLSKVRTKRSRESETFALFFQMI